MKSDALTRSTNRSLSDQEEALLVHALEKAGVIDVYNAQVETVRVVSESTSSWPILEFSVKEPPSPDGGGMEVLADLQYHAGQCLMGLMVYSKNGSLAGMECWSIDGLGDPDSWPSPSQLSHVCIAKDSPGPSKLQ